MIHVCGYQARGDAIFKVSRWRSGGSSSCSLECPSRAGGVKVYKRGKTKRCRLSEILFVKIPAAHFTQVNITERITCYKIFSFKTLLQHDTLVRAVKG